MKKIFLVFIAPLFLTGCFQMVAVLPSAVMSGVVSGNTLQAGVSFGVNYGFKQTTGKTPMEHVISYSLNNEKIIEQINKDLQSAFVPESTVLE